jgi:hypothetical protein
MSRTDSMKTRSRSMTVSQFGLQEWLMKRASLPLTPASITTRELTTKRKVWPSSCPLAS